MAAGPGCSVFVAHLAVQFQSGVPAGMVLCWFVSNCAEALLGAVLMLRVRADGAHSFEPVRAGRRCSSSARWSRRPVRVVLPRRRLRRSSTGGATHGYWTVWRTRVPSNVLAALTLVPVILTDGRRQVAGSPPGMPPQPMARSRGPLPAALRRQSARWSLPCTSIPGRTRPRALLYAPLPLLVWRGGALRALGARARSLLLCALLARSGAPVHGAGPVRRPSSPAGERPGRSVVPDRHLESR